MWNVNEWYYRNAARKCKDEERLGNCVHYWVHSQTHSKPACQSSVFSHIVIHMHTYITHYPLTVPGQHYSSFIRFFRISNSKWFLFKPHLFSLFRRQLEPAFPLVIWQSLLTSNNNLPALHIWIVHCFLSVLLVTPTSIVITEKTPQLRPIASLLHSFFIAFDFWHSREIWELREKREK